MTTRKLLWIAVAALVVAGAAMLFLRARDDDVAASGRPLPTSMAAIGDSITQAVAVRDDALGAAPEHSWATGTDPNDPIASHAERLTAAGALAAGIYNNSVPGSRMADAPAQAQSAVEQHVEYVLVLMGANDVCAADASAMTPVDTFRQQFTETIGILKGGLPNVSIYVASIPDISHLWEVGRDSLGAQVIWDNAGTCPPILSSGASASDRALASERNEAYNSILEEVCTAEPACRYDGGTVFESDFSAEDIGPLDHFHPSMEGQAHLAEVSWARGFWPDL